MLDLAFKHLLEQYLELHSGAMLDAVRGDVSAQRQQGGVEPKGARAFCTAWADVLAAVQAELAALQGGSHTFSRHASPRDLLHAPALSAHMRHSMFHMPHSCI